MIYAFIENHPEHAVARWAAFVEVSTSGYYAWQQEREGRQVRDDAYAAQVQRIFDQSGGTAFLGVTIMFELLCILAHSPSLGG